MSKPEQNALTAHQFTLFYDGDCPICQKEVRWLRWKNTEEKLGLQDIHAPGFDPGIYGTTFDAMMAEIHGAYPDGRVVKGMDAFRAAYRAVGLGWLLAPTRWPLLGPLFDALYAVFARRRLSLGRLFKKETCTDGHCQTRLR